MLFSPTPRKQQTRTLNPWGLCSSQIKFNPTGPRERVSDDSEIPAVYVDLAGRIAELPDHKRRSVLADLPESDRLYVQRALDLAAIAQHSAPSPVGELPGGGIGGAGGRSRDAARTAPEDRYGARAESPIAPPGLRWVFYMGLAPRVWSLGFLGLTLD